MVCALLMNTKDGKALLGERLKWYREHVAEISILELARKTETARQIIYDIEKGEYNFSIDAFEKILAGCGVSIEQLLRGMVPEDVNPAHEKFHAMLRTILDADDPELTVGIKINLEAISEKAARLKRARPPGHSEHKGGQTAAQKGNVAPKEKKKPHRPARESAG